MEAELAFVRIDLIDDHPRNPRVVMRQDVIDGIVANMNGEYPKQHAMRVRKVGDRFQLISGHHRKQAAIAKGFNAVWCWVEDLDDDEAFMQLVTSNNQGELDPLEIGIHAFEAVPEGKRGRGNKGDGLTAYAERIGQKQPNVSVYRKGGEVAKFIYQYMNLDGFIGKALHLAAIHKLPRETWDVAANWIASSGASVVDIKAIVDRVEPAIVSAASWPQWFPPAMVFDRVAKSKDFNASTIEKLTTLATFARSFVQDSKSLGEDVWLDFAEWLNSNAAGDSWNYRQVDAKVEEIKAMEAAAEEVVIDCWRLGTFSDHLKDLQDGSVRLVLTDPPFGMDYQSNRRTTKHDKIAADGTVADAVDLLRTCIHQLLPKLDTDAHVLVFCRWDSEGPFQAVLRTCGLDVKSSIIWVKDNHGSGDLRGGFAPKHERVIHAVKGSPQLFVREPDVLECAKVSSDNHPTEKPVQLLKRLINATTVEGQLVVDPFAGVASTCVAAKESNRKWFGCEIDEDYYKTGSERLGG